MAIISMFLPAVIILSMIQCIATSEVGNNSTQTVDIISPEDTLLHPHHGFGAGFDHNVTQSSDSSENATSQESVEYTSDAARFPPLISAAILKQLLSGKPIKITVEREFETKVTFRNYGEKESSKDSGKSSSKKSTSAEGSSLPHFYMFRRTGNADVPILSK